MLGANHFSFAPRFFCFHPEHLVPPARGIKPFAGNVAIQHNHRPLLYHHLRISPPQRLLHLHFSLALPARCSRLLREASQDMTTEDRLMSQSLATIIANQDYSTPMSSSDPSPRMTNATYNVDALAVEIPTAQGEDEDEDEFWIPKGSSNKPNSYPTQPAGPTRPGTQTRPK